MDIGSRLKRKLDGVIFTVTFLSHWSEIQSEDGAETDTVKWGMGNLFVGANKGHIYYLLLKDAK